MRKGVFAGLVVALALLIMVGMYAYARQPSRAVSNAVSKLASARTQHFHAVIALEKNPAIQSLVAEATSMTVTLDGSWKREPDSATSLVSDITMNTKSEAITLEMGGQLRLIGDKAYLLVAKAPAAVLMLAKLKDQWAELPRGNAPQNPAPSASGPLFQDVKSGRREKIDGQTTIKYETHVTEQGMIRFMDNLASILGTRLTDQQIENLRANLKNVDSLPVTLWVTPWSQELVQLEVQVPESAVRYTISFSGRNRAVSHEIPPDARPIRDILEP